MFFTVIINVFFAAGDGQRVGSQNENSGWLIGYNLFVYFCTVCLLKSIPSNSDLFFTCFDLYKK